MKARIFTDEEIKILNNNPFVVKVKYKREIEYDDYFKLWCALQRKYFEERTAREMFELAGFNIKLLNDRLPQARVKMWSDRYNQFGIDYFIPDYKYATLKKYLDNALKSSKDLKYQKIIDEILIMLKWSEKND